MTKRIMLRILLGLLGFLMILFIFLPLIVRKVVINNSKEWVGRSISLEKLKVNYFTGTAKLINFKLYEADDTTVFISFDTLIIDTEPYRYISDDIVIEQLYLKGLTSRVVMYESSFNFDDLLAFHQPEDSASATDKASAHPLKFELSNFELKDAFFAMNDATIDKQMELSNLNFFVPYLSWDQEHSSEAGLRFNFKNGGFFQSSIDVDPIGGKFAADVILKGLDITGYADFVKKYIDVGDFEGKTDLEINLEGNIKEPDKIKAVGLFVLNDFRLFDHKQQELFDVDQFRVRVKEADLARSRFIIDSVYLAKPSLYFEMHDSTNNITDYIEKLNPEQPGLSSEQDSTEFDELEPELYYALNTFIIENGIVDIVDKRTGEPFKYHLSELQLTTDSINSNSSWVESQSNMLLNNRGKLVAQVGVSPKNPMDHLSLDYTITDFMLSDLNIYSRHYMGFPILYGDMYYKAHTEITDGQVISENKLIIHNVELGDKGGGLYDLPLKFALFLLKDKDGVITLDIPVRGDLKDPKVSVGKIVWNTFKNLIVKAAAAPVKLLSGLIGADPADIDVIEYDFMDTVFTEKRQKQLDLLLQLEQQKPALEIELVYLNDPELEKREIAISVVGNMYDSKGNQYNYKTDKDEFQKFVFTEVATDTISVEAACVKIADTEVVDSISMEFDRIRAEGLMNYLKDVNDSTEILVIPLNQGAPKNLGNMPRFEVKYGMKEEHIE